MAGSTPARGSGTVETMRIRASVGLFMALSGCASLLGIDEPDENDGVAAEAGATSSSSGTSEPDPTDAARGGSSGRSSSSGSVVQGDADAADDVVCPSADPRCEPETVVTHLRSPGQLAVFGAGQLAFREHARGDAGAYSVLRVYDPSGTCTDGACLTTLGTDADRYWLFAGNAHHLCYSIERPLEIHCHDATTLAPERTLTNSFWRYQAGFADDNRLIFTTEDGGNTSIQVVDVTAEGGAPQTVIPADGSFFEHLAVQPEPADARWMAWFSTRNGRRVVSRPLYDLTTSENRITSDVISMAAVADQVVWATAYDVSTSRYNIGGAVTSLTGAPFGPCAFDQERTFRSITPGDGSVIAIEGCSIPGSLGSVLVEYKLDLSTPTLLANAPGALSSAVVLGKYVYYTIAKLPSTADESATEEIRRVRYR